MTAALPSPEAAERRAALALVDGVAPGDFGVRPHRFGQQERFEVTASTTHTRVLADHLPEPTARLFAASKALAVRNAELLLEVAALREALTPSGATKAEYLGEFRFTEEIHDDLEEDEGRTIDLIVPWTVVKDVMKAVTARAEATAQAARQAEDVTLAQHHAAAYHAHLEAELRELEPRLAAIAAFSAARDAHVRVHGAAPYPGALRTLEDLAGDAAERLMARTHDTTRAYVDLIHTHLHRRPGGP